MLIDLSVKDYASKLASEEAAPGGGSAAALSGLLAASLMEMVINLTVDREEYAAYRDLLKDKQTILLRLHSQLQGLVDRDAAAFNSVMEAYKMPKETGEQKAARLAAIQEGYKKASQVPLETARACLEVLKIGEALLGKINSHAVSDLAVGALAGHTGVVGALLNTAINLSAIKDEAYVKELNGQISALKTEGGRLVATIQNYIYADQTFAELR